MERELGEKKALALQGYQSKALLTQEEATTVLQTIWPKAPRDEVFKGALLCHQYGLNPLMKHLFLIPFEGKAGTTWASVLGIKAKRLLASRRASYGYVDGPRIMTRQEQEEILGEVDEHRIWAITVLQDGNGNKAPGYGNWPRGGRVYGEDKGNSAANMAMIRSESAALDRLRPAEMPSMDVIPEEFVTNISVEEEPTSNMPTTTEPLTTQTESSKPSVKETPMSRMTFESIGDMLNEAKKHGVLRNEIIAYFGFSTSDLSMGDTSKLWPEIVDNLIEPKLGR